MTGLGAYFYIVWGIWLRHCLNGRQEEFALSWPSIFSLPEIIRAADRNVYREVKETRKQL